MSVTRDEVDRMAALARLELEEDEAGSLLADLNGILEHMETLGEAELEGTEESGEAHREGTAPLREDGARSPDPLALGPGVLAPAWEDGFFSVPRLPGLEGGEEP